MTLDYAEMIEVGIDGMTSLGCCVLDEALARLCSQMLLTTQTVDTSTRPSALYRKIHHLTTAGHTQTSILMQFDLERQGLFCTWE